MGEVYIGEEKATRRRKSFGEVTPFRKENQAKEGPHLKVQNKKYRGKDW